MKEGEQTRACIFHAWGPICVAMNIFHFLCYAFSGVVMHGTSLCCIFKLNFDTNEPFP